ncbi:MAG: hypothetical protein K0S09_2353 [Sphingobacteriaceae bacterium]|jgi:hypothetical protein|nr:hypothetical protein [Sphingobacteriaceae bacterium]
MENSTPKLLNIKYLLCAAVLLFYTSAFAQLGKTLTPDVVLVQYAGSIGYGSIGAGYDVFKNKRGNLDFVYGYVPRSKGGILHIITTKFAYRPFKINLGENFTLYPVNPGVFFSYHLGDEFALSRDHEYFEKGYYWWSTALRSHLSFSNELKINTAELLHDKGIKNVSLYSEFNTNDLYLVSWYKNQETMSITDIFKVGVGVRMAF